MKNVVLSADGDRMVYSVPDSVADRLDEYCLAFTEWLYASPHARKYRIGGGLCYNEPLPEPWQDCPQFNF